MRSLPRFLQDGDSLYDEGNFDLAGYLSSSAPAATPVASPAPAAATPVASPAPAPVDASGWTPWTDMVNAKQIGDYYYMPNTELIPEWVGGGQRLTGLTRYKMSDWQKTQDPYNQRTEDPYATNFVPYELVDPATGQVIGGVTKPEYTTGWQPGQAWDPTWKNPALVGGDLYAPRYEEDPYSPGQQKLAGLIRYVGGKKPAPGQTGYVQDLDVTGRGSSPVTTLTPYLVDPRGNTFFEALMGALPAMIPIGMAAMGAAGAAGAAGGAGAGIAEGMAPGVLAPASAAELAAVNSIVGAPSALDAGMDVYPNLPETPTPTAPPSESFRPSQNYGPGMSGAQTSAYDKILELTGSKELADLGARAVGGASSIEDLIKNKVKDELKKAVTPDKTPEQKAAKSGADLLSMLGIMGLLTSQRQPEAPTPVFQAGPALDLAALFGHTPTRRG